MCSTFTTDCRYNNSFIKLIRNVFCPDKKCSEKLCVHEKTLQSFESSDYQCPQCNFTCQVRSFPCEKDTLLFFLKNEQGIYVFTETQKSIQDVIGDLYRQTCPNEKCVSVSTNKYSSFYVCKKCEDCSHVLNIPFREQIPTLPFFGGDGTPCFARKTSRDYQKEKASPFLKSSIRQSQSATLEPVPKKGKNHCIYGIIVSTPHWLI